MKIASKLFLFFGIAVLGLLFFTKSMAQSIANDKESARIFVQTFYNWYGKVYANQKHIEAHHVVLKYHSKYLDKNLFNALDADDRGQAKRPKEIIGLGCDPFTNSLDTRKGYQTGLVIQKGDTFFVDVHDIGSGQSKDVVLASKLISTAEVTKVDGNFVFVDFIYPKMYGYIDGSLLSVLDSLHKDRIKQGIEKF